MIYLTTDTHFNHDKIIEFCGRPPNFQERLKNRFFELSYSDTLIHLGDICIGNDKDVHLEYIAPILAKKILVRGNHDKKSNTWYENHGWDFVCTRFDRTINGTKVSFTHKPIPWDGFFDINIHGHLHNLGDDHTSKVSMVNWLIALEKDGYGPLPIDMVLGKIKKSFQKED